MADIRVDWNRLQSFTAAVFEHAGLSAEDAAVEAEVLLWANLRGVDSHGVQRVAGYVRSVEAGHYNPRPDIRIERETPATMLIEADRAFGPVVTTYAMKQAIAKARGCPGYTTARSPSPYREEETASSPWIWPRAWPPSASWTWPWTGTNPSPTRGRWTRTANRRRTRNRPGVQNSFIGAIDIAAFTDPVEYRANIDELTATMKGLPRAEGVDELFVPGEPEERVHPERIVNGIPLPPGTREKLSEVAVKYGLEVPWEE